MQIPCRFEGVVMEVLGPACNQHETCMETAWKLHGNSMKPASVRVLYRIGPQWNLFQEKLFFFSALLSCRLFR